MRMFGSEVMSILFWACDVPCDVYFILSLPCLRVGDDHVTRYMGANVDASEHVDT